MGTEVKKRALGLDYGSKTVGVAVSDGLGITAQGVEIIRRTQENKLRKTLARIEELIAEYDVGILVLGYPKNMNNTVGDRAEKSLEFQKMLEKLITIILLILLNLKNQIFLKVFLLKFIQILYMIQIFLLKN